MGEVGVANASAGHSTKRVKLKRKPAFIWYSSESLRTSGATHSRRREKKRE